MHATFVLAIPFLPMPSSFITRDLVVMKLIKERCKLADAQAVKDQKNEFIDRWNLNANTKRSEYEESIRAMFPPRKQWCGIGKKRRCLDTGSRNQLRLKKTYLKAKKNGSTATWYKELCDYADGIGRMVDNTEGEIPPPRISVIEKKVKQEKCLIECRPICSFDIKVKIIFSLLNKYLTKLFDSYFYECSYAFRLPNNKGYHLQHLNAVSKVRDYRIAHLGKSLYVAECDMQKFYDTISHGVIKTRFSLLLHRAKKDGKITSTEAKLVRKWFFRYVDCFNFLEHIYRNNKKPHTDNFWHGIKNSNGYDCKIKWIDKEDYGNGYSAFLRRARKRKGYVGVPQGGALSGVIANLVMHHVDKAVYEEIGGEDVLYCRFCDDMILIGTDNTVVDKVFKTYNRAIKKSQLIPHPNKDIDVEHMSEFWNGKTRGPYEWYEKGDNVYPWITFVGFDINWKGNLRIRKASFKRQIAKQNKIANELLVPYARNKTPRYCAGTIKASLVSRLIGMSVGRVKLWDYQDNPNVHSWMSAFSILDENPWSAKQLKALDRHRQVVIARANKKLLSIKCTNKKKEGNPRENQRERFMYHGCPFSYYGQCFKYKNKLK